jgi:hypothetical protein
LVAVLLNAQTFSATFVSDALLSEPSATSLKPVIRTLLLWARA